MRQVQTSTSYYYLFTPITKSWQISNEFLYKHDLKKERKKMGFKNGFKKKSYPQWVHVHSDAIKECSFTKDFTVASSQMVFIWVSNAIWFLWTVEFKFSFSKNKRKNKYFLTFPADFSIPIFFFQFELQFLQFFRSEKPPGTSNKSIVLPEIVLTFHCLNKLF